MNAVTQKQRQTGPAGGTGETKNFVSPAVNIFETADGYVLEAEMPGVNKKGLEILLEANELTIIGQRDPDQASGTLLYHETRPVDFRRVFELDPAIDTEKIAAKVENGVLTLTLPKSERVKPRRIVVSD